MRASNQTGLRPELPAFVPILQESGAFYDADSRSWAGGGQRAGRQPPTATPATSKRAPNSSGPEPRKARAGGSPVKYSRYTRLNTP